MFGRYYCIVILLLENFGKKLRKDECLQCNNGTQKHERQVGLESFHAS